MAARTLPDGFIARAPVPADAPAIAGLIAACQEADGDEPDASAEEVLRDWEGLDPEQDAVLVVAPDGTAAAYADVLNRRYVQLSVYGSVHPRYRGLGLGSWLVQWGEAWIRERMHLARAEAQVTVQHYIRSTNTAALRLMERHGYRPVRDIWLMAITLDQPPPAPEWPEGITVRTFVPGQDERATFEAVEEAFSDIWGRPPSTFERWLSMTQSERKDPELWRLAIETDSGQIVGTCLGQEISGKGWIGSVGVRRPWRGRGIGLALLRDVFGVYYRRGVREVELSVDSESRTGAPRLYRRAGMEVKQNYILHRKEIRPGIDLSTTAEQS
ncbi:GNAT family N-acetyltransferase [Sphaerobacter sp.]|uniref:GNAT family N-acetyltransferase n=1 Tax=Sphaerobacter sp. TaxID=2099654 RepID=UPI001DB7B810|nr:GNAT family N-acetyltransferase [Sphaerobacter sp.]MBX5444976.1 GNAT family N-acetyltransferase [Sphaerobacter sp.]